MRVKPNRTRFVDAAILLVLLLLAGGLTGCFSKRTETSPPGSSTGSGSKKQAASKSLDWNEIHVTSGAAPSYVKDSVCATCHKEVYESYQHVGKANSFFPPSADSAIEDFENNESFHAPSARYYEVSLNDGAYVFKRYQLDEKGQPINVYRRKVDWILGSGAKARTYLYQTEAGELYQLPIAWYSQEGQWAMAPGFDRYGHEGIQRRVDRECMFCHNAYPEVETGSDVYGVPARFPHKMPHGIGCQRCHGPGAEHVKAAIQKADKENVLASIVNPAKLEPHLREDVCNSCHWQPSAALSGVRKFGRGDFSFRPGEALSEYLVKTDVVQAGKPKEDRFEINHHSYRLQQSRCFTESEGGLSCLACHDPHRQVPQQNRIAHYRDACFKCHNNESCQVTPAEHADANLEDCIGCHMPQRRTQDFVHVTTTDHFIQRVSAGEQLLDPLKESRPVLEDVTFPDSQSAPDEKVAEVYRACALLRASNFRHLAAVERLQQLLAVVDVPGIEPFLDLAQAQAKLKRFEDLEETLTQLLVDYGDHPRIRQWFGLALLGQKNTNEAKKQLRLVLKKRPNDPEANYNLGLLLTAEKQYGEAIASFEQALAGRPNMVLGWYYLGYSYLQLDQIDKAIFALRRAAEIEPGAMSVYPALHRTLTQAGQAAEGFRYANHQEMLQRLDAASRAGDYDDVAFQDSKGVELAPVPKPDLGRLEAKVVEQIGTVRDSFEKLVARPNSSRGQLAEAYGALGQVYHAYELHDAATACYANAVILVPGDHRFPHLLGVIAENTGELQEAIEQFQKAVELNSEYEATRVRLGDAYLQLNRLAEAREQFEQVLKQFPRSSAAKNGLGNVALAEKKYGEAVDHFEAALKQVPSANRLHYSLAMAYRGLGELEKAEEHLKKRGTVGLRPVDALVDGMQQHIQGERLHLIRGRLAFNAGRFQEAFESFSLAVEAKPDSARARVNLGTTLSILEKPGQAIAEYREAIKHDPRNFAAHYNLGLMLQQSEDYEQAEHHLAIALELKPNDHAANRVLAATMKKAGRDDDALKQYLRIIEIAPADDDAVLGASALLQKKEQFQKALSLLDDFHRKAPQNEGVAHTLGKLLATCPDLSLRDGERAISLVRPIYQKTRKWDHLETLAQSLGEAGKCEEAAKAQKQLIAEAKRIKSDSLVKRLSVGLKHYEAGPPCRPLAVTAQQEPSDEEPAEPSQDPDNKTKEKQPTVNQPKKEQPK